MVCLASEAPRPAGGLHDPHHAVRAWSRHRVYCTLDAKCDEDTCRFVMGHTDDSIAFEEAYRSKTATVDVGAIFHGTDPTPATVMDQLICLAPLPRSIPSDHVVKSRPGKRVVNTPTIWRS